jgi:hypothetical protein
MPLDEREQPSNDVDFGIGAGGTRLREQARLAYGGAQRSLDGPTEGGLLNLNERYLRIEQAKTHGFCGLSL